MIRKYGEKLKFWRFVNNFPYGPTVKSVNFRDDPLRNRGDKYLILK